MPAALLPVLAFLLYAAWLWRTRRLEASRVPRVGSILAITGALLLWLVFAVQPLWSGLRTRASADERIRFAAQRDVERQRVFFAEVGVTVAAWPAWRDALFAPRVLRDVAALPALPVGATPRFFFA